MRNIAVNVTSVVQYSQIVLLVITKGLKYTYVYGNIN